MAKAKAVFHLLNKGEVTTSYEQSSWFGLEDEQKGHVIMIPVHVIAWIEVFDWEPDCQYEPASADAC